SMQVLKDAASASIYGSRASNGVIIITTKKGKNNEIVASYKGRAGVQVLPNDNPFNLINNPQDMADFRWMAVRNSGGTPGGDLYGRGESPVLPDYLVAGNSTGVSADQVDLSKYNVNPNYTDASELDNMYRIIKANKQGTN